METFTSVTRPLEGIVFILQLGEELIKFVIMWPMHIMSKLGCNVKACYMCKLKMLPREA